MINENKLEQCNDVLLILAKQIENRLHDILGQGITITSGFRDESNEYYNPSSYHSFGLAFDFTIPEYHIFLWFHYIVDLVINFRFKGFKVVEFELIADKDNQNKYHCHVAIDDTPDKELKMFTKGY